MSEIDDSVFGGSMDRYEFYKAEFEIDEELQNFRCPPFEYQQVTVYGEEMKLHRFNTKVYYFSAAPYGDMEINHDIFDHVYIQRKDKAPYYLFRPEDPEQLELWEALVGLLAEINVPHHFGLPEKMDYEMLYNHLRGGEDINDTLNRILDG